MVYYTVLNGGINMMNFSTFLNDLIYILPAVAIALSVHEFAHAFVSYKLGDYSQKDRGRLTLNPLKHLDPLGTLSLIVFGFGWAKPVQVDPYFYKNKKEGMIWTAMAGPLMNFIVGFVMVLLYMAFIRFEWAYQNEFMYYLFQLVANTATINVGLGIFNLIPIPPLDGSKILLGILNEETYFKLMRYEMYLSFIMIMLLMAGVLNEPLFHARTAILNVFVKVAGTIFGVM